MNPLRCLVVDDEPLAVKLISGYVERTPFLVLEASARSAVDALSLLGERRFDLVFLDIQMPGLTGVEFAEMLPESTRVVFITAYTDFALDGFRVNALDYLLKPVSYDDFRRAASRALNFYSERQARTSDIDFITVKSEYRLRRIPVSSIRYVEGLKDYVKIYVEGEVNPVLTLMSMKTLEQTLPSDSFMRVHRSFIIIWIMCGLWNVTVYCSVRNQCRFPIAINVNFSAVSGPEANVRRLIRRKKSDMRFL